MTQLRWSTQRITMEVTSICNLHNTSEKVVRKWPFEPKALTDSPQQQQYPLRELRQHVIPGE